MKLPKRVPQHISETASFKLFSSKIPDNWIIRDITERDYGIDCYLELVNEDNELTGELALIQLKSRQSIPWTADDYYTLTGVDIATSNYWYKFAVPVFIFLADIDNKELYFISVDYHIKRNFSVFVEQRTFNYKFKKTNRFEGKDGVFSFKFIFYYEYYRQQFENELLFFLSNLQHFHDFQNEHYNQDFHLGIEDEDLIYFEAMHRNFKFLCTYLNIDNPIPKLSELKRRSREKFKEGYHYDLYEHDLTEWVGEFQKLTSEITKKLKQFLQGELHYWLIVNPTVFNYVSNIRED
ncbi:DUF4365 domain-containing protein [Flavobacterium supellecticarium]|uniref:DUF4365 domain-containing protein n=1 Tax=Flavobacterium supellecticarium TaxID=2565924 RepID=A0A4S4A3I0_9FLAO|nr:DUF4365 domain-containing protein [Flavobacterium supellecticarium]THF52987.1 DUF4365 domain-containing protein [Flavobacterium supellecticarium]